jgi:hypothetical protein
MPPAVEREIGRDVPADSLRNLPRGQSDRSLTRAELRTPKAAAIAGMLFSVLLVAIVVLLRASVPADPQESGEWLSSHSKQVRVAVELVPFAGIAFLWFIGVLRDHLSQQEDRFFSTVFFGSGVLFLSMLFAFAAFTSGILLAFATQPQALIDSPIFHFARAASYSIANIYMVKMAAVFMITTSTVAISTGIAPRWIALGGYGLAAVLLIGNYFIPWGLIAFPIWIFLLSSCILRDRFRAVS